MYATMPHHGQLSADACSRAGAHQPTNLFADILGNLLAINDDGGSGARGCPGGDGRAGGRQAGGLGCTAGTAGGVAGL